jgi:hypothetical protein
MINNKFNNLYSYQDFLNEKKSIDLKEGKLWDFLKGMANKLAGYAKKIKESGEIDKLLITYKADADKLFDVQLKDEIQNLYTKVGVDPNADKNKTEGTPSGETTDTKTTDGKPTVQGEKKVISTSYTTINEADAAPATTTAPGATTDYISLIGAPSSEKNPISEAISKFMNLKKAMMKKYLESDNKAVKLYAIAKLAVLEEHLIMKKIDIYTKLKDKKYLEAAKKDLEASQKNTAELGAELETAVNNPDNKGGGVEKIEKDKIYIYTNASGETSYVMGIDDKQVCRISKQYKKDEKIEIDKLEGTGEDVKPFEIGVDNLKNLKPVDDADIEKVKQKLAEDIKKLAGGAQAEYKVDDSVIYLRKDKTMDEWTKLTDEQKAVITKPPTSDIVAQGKITEIKGDQYIISYDPNDVSKVADKTKDKIIKKVEETK